MLARLLLALALMGSSPAAASPWSRPGGDAWGSGAVGGSGAITGALEDTPGQRFSIASPEVATADGLLTPDGSALLMPSRGRVTAFDLDGGVLWTSPTLGATHVVEVVDLLGTGRAQVLVADAGIGGGIHLLDLATGAALWSFTDLAFGSGVDPREVARADFDGDGVDEIAFTGWIYGAHDVHLVDLSTADGAPRETSAPLSGSFLGLTELVAVDALDEPGVEIVVPMSTDLDVVRTCGSTDVGAFCDSVDGTVCLCGVALLTDVWAGRAFPRPRPADVDADGLEELVIVNEIPTWDRGFGVLSVADALAGGRLDRWYYDYGAGSSLPLGVAAEWDSAVVVSVFDAGADEAGLDGAPLDDGLSNPGGWTVGVFDAADGALLAALDDALAIGVADVDGDGEPELVGEPTTGRALAGELGVWDLACDPDCAWVAAGSVIEGGGVRYPERFDVSGVPPRALYDVDGRLLVWSGDELIPVRVGAGADTPIPVGPDDALVDVAGGTIAVLEGAVTVRAHAADGTPRGAAFPVLPDAPPRWLTAPADDRAAPLVDAHLYATTQEPSERADADHRLGDGVLLVDDLDGDGAPDAVVWTGDEGGVEVARVELDPDPTTRWTAAAGPAGYAVHNPWTATVGDVNHDGVADVVLDLRRGFDSISLVLDGADGSELHRAELANRRSFFVPPLLIDLDDDADPELVRVAERAVSVFEIGVAEPTAELPTSDFVVRGLWHDLDADGSPELLGAMSFQADRQELAAYRLVPALEPLWEVTDLRGPADVEQAIARVGESVSWISADGSLELRSTADGSRLPGWPLELARGEVGAGGAPLTAQVVLDIDGDDALEVVVGAKDGWVYAVDIAEPSLDWRIFVGARVVNLAAADVDGDDRLELLVAADDGTARVIDGLGVDVTITSPDPADCVKTSPLLLRGTSRGVDGVRMEVAGRSVEAELADDGAWTGSVAFPLVGGLIEVVAVGTRDGVDAAFDARLLPSHEDGDGDGTTACGGDCDDADPARSPDFEELVCDGIDNDCEPSTGDGECADPEDPGCGCGCDGARGGAPAAAALLAIAAAGWRRRW